MLYYMQVPYDALHIQLERWLSWSKAHDWKSCIRGTVSRVRIPFSPPKRKAHASHGPSALHMIKGIRRAEEGTPRCGVLPPRGARARASASAERKQAAARAENPFLCAASEQALYRLLRLFSLHEKSRSRRTPLRLLCPKGRALRRGGWARARTTMRSSFCVKAGAVTPAPA